MAPTNISSRTNRVLKVILIAFLAIVLRIWHLGVVQRDEKILEAQKPQQRTILVRADRGTLCDRFHIPLALNRICYNAAIYYGQIAQIPSTGWRIDEEGRRERVSERKEYIRNLSELLAAELDLDAGRVEDLIHSKASLFPHAPYILKAGISEEEYYRLKMLESEWLGVHAEIGTERYYPLGKTACDSIGTMGAISQRKYSEIAQETALLKETIDFYEQGIAVTPPAGYESFEQVYERFSELKEKAYTLNDLVGKTGIEGRFEEELRGFFGKKTFAIDQKGRSLRELPGGRPAIPGRQVILSLSSELQQFAESLLAQNEKIRDGRSLGLDPADKTRKVQKQPWIKGGAIAAIDPNTGEVLALASYPRFDPNDFIPSANPSLKAEKQRQASRWLETERFIGAVWDGKDVLERERAKGKSGAFFQEREPLTWDFFLDLALPKESPLKTFFTKFDDVKSAIQIQEDFEEALYFSGLSDPRVLLDALFPPEPSLHKAPSRQAVLDSLRPAGVSVRRLENALSQIPSNGDKLFLIDLCRLAVYSPAFTDSLIAQTGFLKLSAYHSLRQALLRADASARKTAQETFRQNEFKAWRDANQKSFLAEKRKEEKERKTYARPFVDYLDQKEEELFASHWQERRLPILAAWIQERGEEAKLCEICHKLGPELAQEFLRTFRSFAQLDRPLLGSYKSLRRKGKEQTEKDLAAAFYPIGGFGFSRSYAFQSGSPQGSLFKLITGFESLRQGKSLTLIDDLTLAPQNVAYALNGAPYPRFYKGGRLPRSHASQVGKIDLLGALEQSSNSYFAILAGDLLENPEDLSRAALQFGYGQKTGIELPGEFAGKVPNDLKRNRTGLYSTAIGQHTLLNTPLQTASMLAAIANGGKLLKPKIVKEAAGAAPDREPLSAFAARSYFAEEELRAIGIHFPLFTKVHSRSSLEESVEQPVEIRSSLFLPASIRSALLEGMDRAVWSPKGSARPSAIKALLADPMLMRDYLSLQHQMIGKTSTAEVVASLSVNPSNAPQIYKNIWFGAISFEADSLAKARWDRPELVVVVFLRYGDGGKEAAPLAAQMIRKWRDIKAKHAD